jgi:SOS response regulatory protein OraA/RecX
MPSNQTFEDPDLKHIYQKMLEWLSVGEVSEQRLIDRILRLKRLYPDTVRYVFYTKANAQKVVEYLRDQGLVDDRRYATRLFELLKDRKDGLRAIRRKMLARKLPKGIVDEVLNDFEQSGQSQDLEKIIALTRVKYERLHTKFGTDSKKKYQIRSKLYAWLAMRGFRPEDSKGIIEKALK